MWFAAQTHHFIIRGGIAKGRVWSRQHAGQLVIVSEALLRAVELERTVKKAVVLLDPELDVPVDAWLPRFQEGPARAWLLHYEDLTFVSPFGRYWFASAAPRFQQMKDAAGQEHAEKYDWLLALHSAVASDEDLTPQPVIEALIEAGMVRRKLP